MAFNFGDRLTAKLTRFVRLGIRGRFLVGGGVRLFLRPRSVTVVVVVVKTEI